MSLMDIFGSVPGMQRRPDWMNYEGPASPSMSLAVPDQGAVNYYASQPRQEPKKGGGLGEVLKTLFAGALDGVARHYGFEPGGYNTMMQQREEDRQQGLLMQKLMAERDDYVWKKGVDQQFAGPPELPADVRSAEWYRGASPEQRENWDRLHSQLLALQQGGAVARVRPGGAAELVVAPNPGDQPLGAPTGDYREGQTATNPQTGQKVQYRNGQWVPVGGGVSNGPGNFR